MKKTISALSLLLALLSLFSLVSCDGNTIDSSALWEHAIYRKDVTLGNGAKTVEVEVKAGEDAITVTLKTDKEKLGEALLEHNLIEGENGLYTKVNGITADYNVDKSYWGFYQSGELMRVGMDETPISDGDHYELIYTK